MSALNVGVLPAGGAGRPLPVRSVPHRGAGAVRHRPALRRHGLVRGAGVSTGTAFDSSTHSCLDCAGVAGAGRAGASLRVAESENRLGGELRSVQIYCAARLLDVTPQPVRTVIFICRLQPLGPERDNQSAPRPDQHLLRVWLLRPRDPAGAGGRPRSGRAHPGWPFHYHRSEQVRISADPGRGEGAREEYSLVTDGVCHPP